VTMADVPPELNLRGLGISLEPIRPLHERPELRAHRSLGSSMATLPPIRWTAPSCGQFERGRAHRAGVRPRGLHVTAGWTNDAGALSTTWSHRPRRPRASSARFIRTCCATRQASIWPTPATTPGPSSSTWDTATSNIPCATANSHRTGSRASGRTDQMTPIETLRAAGLQSWAERLAEN